MACSPALLAKLRGVTAILTRCLIACTCLVWPALAQVPVNMQITDDSQWREPLPTPASELPPTPPPMQESGASVGRLPAVSTAARERVLHAVQGDLDALEESASREINRLREGLIQLDSGFQRHVLQQRSMHEALQAARREAQEAAAAAARDRQRFETLLQESPWNDVEQPPPKPAATPTPDSPKEPTPAAPAHDLQLGPPENSAKASDQITPPHSSAESGPQAIAGTAVDRPRLADSLYGSGQYDLALRLYQQLADAAQNPKDQAWYFYQIAGCFRHRGEGSQSAKFYRIVAGMTDADGLSDYAKWWLSNMEQQAGMKQGLEKIRQSLRGSDPQNH